MNPDSPLDPRSALESNLTALLLGELPHQEAAALHQKLAQDPELAARYERLKHTINLVRETVSSPAQATADQPTPLKLSEERRQKLLQHFKTVAPREFAQPRRRWTPTLLQLGVAAALVLLLASLLLPALAPAKSKSMRSFSMSSLSRSAESAAQAPSSTRGARDENGLTQRLTQTDEESVAGKPATPLAQPVPASVASAGTAIVLPKDGEPADAAANSAFRRRYGLQPETAPAAKTGQTRNDVSGGDYLSRGVTTASPGVKPPADPSSARGGQAELADSSSFSTKLDAAGAMELGKLFNKDVQMPALGEPSTPSQPTADNRKGVELLQERAVAAASPGQAGPKTPEPAITFYAGGAYGGYSSIVQHTLPNPNLVVEGYVNISNVGDVPITSEVVSSPGKDAGISPRKASLSRAPGIALNEPASRQNELFTSGLRASGASEHQKQDVFSLSLQPGAPPVQAGQSAPGTAGDGLGVQRSAETTEARLAATAGDKDKALGFDWYLGNTQTANGQIKAIPGTSDVSQHLNFDARPMPGLSNSDADQVPVLGDTPAAGRSLYRMRGNGLADDGEVNVKGEEKAKSGSSIALPAAPGETTLALNSTGTDQKSQQYSAAKRTLEEAQRLREPRTESSAPITNASDERLAREDHKVASAKQEPELLRKATKPSAAPESDASLAKPAAPAAIPQPEVQTSDNAFSTFSLNVSDVSFKLAAASLEKGVMPEPANVRSEEFINAFDYRDPEPPPGVPVAFAWERAQYPFAQNRDLLRFSIKTAAQGRQPGRPMNIVLLLDTSGSMERADRVQIIREALRVLAGQLQPQDKFSVVTFARTARLWVDGVAGNQAAQVVGEVSGIIPQGGTNLEDAMNLAYQTAQRHYLANGINRVVLLTDGAANLGDVEPETLKQKVESNRKQGIALDCFGIGWEGYNDDLLEVLSRNGDGRYGFINTPEEAATGFAAQLAGALQVAASDVKVQVDFNPARVTAYRQIGYAKHQLTKEQFRDNTVVAAQIGAAESGNALYVVEVNPAGQGPIATVRVRYRVPGTSNVHEHEWPVPYTGNAVPLDQSTSAMRLAATASAFSEWLVSSPYATEVTPDRLLGYLNGVPDIYGADARPKKLEWMLRQAKSISGK